MQPQVRAAAVTCLNAWHTEIGLASMVEQEFISSALATENPNLRAEVMLIKTIYINSTTSIKKGYSAKVLKLRQHVISLMWPQVLPDETCPPII